MHMCLFVITDLKEPKHDMKEVLETMLEPYSENKEVEQLEEDCCKEKDCEECNGSGKYKYWHNPEGHWDWWQTGGRYTGLFDDYKPANDNKNKEVCWLCQGTGKRNDDAGKEARRKNPDYTCNGCNGAGIADKWPTQWAEHKGDINFVRNIKPDNIPYAILAPDGWHEKETWDGDNRIPHKDWNKQAKKLYKQYSDNVVVVVDIHS